MAQQGALIVQSIGLAESTDGRKLKLEAVGDDGGAQWILEVDNAPNLAVALLQAHQRASRLRPEEESLHAATVRTAEARIMGLDGFGAKVAAVDDGLSLYVHLGSTALRFRLPRTALQDLRKELEELLRH